MSCRRWESVAGGPGRDVARGIIRPRWLAGLALLALVGTGNALAGSFTDPMQFTLHAPCDGCEAYLLARGAIQPDTPRSFRENWQMLQVRQQYPKIYFHSPGGNLEGALELGRLIRAAGLDTHVGGPYLEAQGIGRPPEVLVQRAACVSACAYAFLGGVSRSLGENGLLGLHQFFSREGDIGDSPTQVMMTVLGGYLDQMGVDRRFLDFAATTVPDQIKPLSPAQARELNVDNQNPSRDPWRLEAGPGGELVASVSQRVSGRGAEFMLRIWSSGRGLAGEARWRPGQVRMGEAELTEEFTVRGSPNLGFRPPDGNSGVTVVSEGWRRGDDGWFAAAFDPGPDLLSLLENAGELEFSALGNTEAPGIAPRVRFSTRGFPNALRALER